MENILIEGDIYNDVIVISELHECIVEGFCVQCEVEIDAFSDGCDCMCHGME